MSVHAFFRDLHALQAPPSQLLGSAGGPSNAELVEQQRQWQEASAGRALGVQRQRLPAAKARSDVIRTVHQNQVVVISGETGLPPQQGI